MTRICDYEGSQYKTEFWGGNARIYEDFAERIALKHMLPAQGDRIIEVGAGFGRLVDMYAGYKQVVLLDYARTQLEEAQRYLGNDERFVYVVADVYNLPFVAGLFDALVMIRVMHHLEDVSSALRELYRVVQPTGVTIVEHASKQHLKAILRWLLRRQNWNPFSLTPHEFASLNIDFHPRWVQAQFRDAGFAIEDVRTVSHFRLPLLKKCVAPGLLAWLDGLAQPTGRWWQLTPSIFLKATPIKSNLASETGFFKCPQCGSSQLQSRTGALECQQCLTQWEVRDGLYDFKTPLKTPVL